MRASTLAHQPQCRPRPFLRPRTRACHLRLGQRCDPCACAFPRVVGLGGVHRTSWVRQTQARRSLLPQGPMSTERPPRRSSTRWARPTRQSCAVIAATTSPRSSPRGRRPTFGLPRALASSGGRAAERGSVCQARGAVRPRYEIAVAPSSHPRRSSDATRHGTCWRQWSAQARKRTVNRDVPFRSRFVPHLNGLSRPPHRAFAA